MVPSPLHTIGYTVQPITGPEQTIQDVLKVERASKCAKIADEYTNVTVACVGCTNIIILTRNHLQVHLSHLPYQKVCKFHATLFKKKKHIITIWSKPMWNHCNDELN